ncbi:PE family protein [Mycobacterium ulcerans]
MSSFVIATPEFLTAAANDLSGIGDAVRAATGAAAPSTTAIAPLAGDEVSAAVTRMFGAYAQEFQTLSARMEQFYTDCVRALLTGAGAYSGAEAANASPLQTLEQDLLAGINAPSQMLTGRPLIRPRHQPARVRPTRRCRRCLPATRRPHRPPRCRPPHWRRCRSAGARSTTEPVR